MPKYFSSVICIIILSLVFISCTGGDPTPLPSGESLLEPSAAAVVSATGKVMPERWANVAFGASGIVQEVLVAEGVHVRAGQVMARLSASELEQSVEQAAAAVAVAEAQLDLLRAGPRLEAIAQAQASLAVAQTNLALAESMRLTDASAVEQAQAAVDEATAAMSLIVSDLTVDEKELLRQQVEQAKATRYGLQGQRDVLGGQKSRPGYLQGSFEAADGQAMAAENAVSMAELTQRIALAGAKDQERAMARARLAQAEAAARGASGQLDVLERQVEVAQAQVGLAQSGLDAVSAPPRQEELDVALAQSQQAKAALAQAQALLSKAVLTAPFDATVTYLDLRVGEWVSVGRAVASLGDLSDFRIETTDLDEIDVARVREGAAAMITFDALPGSKIEGTVESIAQQASPGAGGTTYKTVIALPPGVHHLLWGMTAFVDIETE